MADIPGQIEHLVQEDRLTQPVWYEWLLGFYRSFSAFKNNAEGAWTVFTPTITAAAGGPPTISSSNCRYRQTGHTVDVIYQFTVVNSNGSSGNYNLSLPKTPSARTAVLIGMENALSGFLVRASLGTGSVTAPMVPATATGVLFTNGNSFNMGGTYEV